MDLQFWYKQIFLDLCRLQVCFNQVWQNIYYCLFSIT
jgi:hypothetical protein